MQIERLSNTLDIKKYLREIGVDAGGVDILSSKVKSNVIYIRDLHVGGANILKQDALSIGADLAVPRGTVTAAIANVDCILIATDRQLQTLSKKELSQPFGLKELAKRLKEIVQTKMPERVEIMGVINTNEDSFFSGSRFKDSHAISAIEKMIEDGADIIDIGGVSSRPGSEKVSVQEELTRVKPILEVIKSEKLFEKVKFSIDSYEPEVISAALDCGFKIVNDITGLESDEVCRLCTSYDATAIIMHMQGTPKSMQKNPQYENILSEVYSFFEARILKAESFGINDIVIDVGIGFGKTLDDNLKLTKHLGHFLTLNKKILFAASRKSMIDKIIPTPVEERLAGTLALHLEALNNGASMLRVHDVKEHVQALKVKQAIDRI